MSTTQQLDRIIQEMWETGWDPHVNDLNLFTREFGLLLFDETFDLFGGTAIFRDPAARLRVGEHPRSIILPLDGDDIDHAVEAARGPRDDTVRLNPFEVQATSDKGYSAMNMNSLTSFNVALDHLPVTAEDFHAPGVLAASLSRRARNTESSRQTSR